jgi:exodeoxyribonuclease VII small subunit
MKRLEEIVALLDGDALDLEASAKLFEEGVALSKELNAKLAEIKIKVETLKEKGGELTLEPFEEEENQ